MTGDALLDRFRAALASRGVPAAGADALLRQIRRQAFLSRAGVISDWAATAKVNRLVAAVERKAAELAP